MALLGSTPSLGAGARLRSTRRGLAVRAVASSEPETARETLLSGVAERSVVNATLPALESKVPEANTSYLLQGTFDRVYAGGAAPGPVPSPTREIALAMYAGGFGPGEFLATALSRLPDSVSKLDNGLRLTITGTKSTAELKVSLFGQETTALSVTSSLEPMGETGLRETYEQVTFGGNVTDLPEALRYSRELTITLLDEELLVVRDETGAPDILKRVGEPIPPLVEDLEEEVAIPVDMSADDKEKLW